MQIMLCAATLFEIHPTIAFIKQQHLTNKIGVQITGIGLTAAAYSITKGIFTHQPKLIVQAGIAGSFKAALLPAQTVVIKSEVLGDLGVVEKEGFKSVFDLGLAQKNEAPWKDGKLVNPHTGLMNATNLQQIAAVSVQQITTLPQQIAWYKAAFSAQVETMEGAALHYVALMENIPFLQLRTISNYVGERNKKEWKLPEAITELNIELQNLLINSLP